MLNHSFGLYIQRELGHVAVTPTFGVSNPEYSMLNYLSINNSVSTVDAILMNLSKVLIGILES
jgi:hypothetical protein